MKPTSPHITWLKWLEAEIRKQKFGKEPRSLYEPIRYIMNLGGKRLRPLLTLYAYALYKPDVKRVVPFALAVEAFHNFTLMHDDIMDKAPLRRGKQTVHKKWNVNTAILAGDVMLVKVYDMFKKIEDRRLRTVLTSFNRCAADVCEGQQWDMEFESIDRVSEQQYVNMIRLKTAMLLGFSLELGAILAGAPARDQKALREFGISIGIGFQLKDDLLDAFADPKKFGKQVGGDIIANKKTYLLIKALENATGKTRSELKSWLSAKRFNKKEKVEAMLRIFNSLGVRDLAEKKVQLFFAKGFKRLDSLTAPESSVTQLRSFARQLIERQS